MRSDEKEEGKREEKKRADHIVSDVARSLFLGRHSTFCFEGGASSAETKGVGRVTQGGPAT